LDYIRRVDDENKRLRVELEYMKEKRNPLAAAIKKIKISESPVFSMESPEHSSDPKFRKKSLQYSKYHK
jgi:seryl-tRNA synthetase